MMWIGLVVGVVLGLILGEIPGALILGFLGWLAGLIASNKRDEKKRAAQGVKMPRDATAPPATLEARVALLERKVAQLEAQLRGEAAPAAPATATQAEAAVAPEPPAADAETPATPATPAPTPAEEPRRALAAPEAKEPPREPAKPNPIVAWLTGGNAIARVGLVILFLGLAFLVKYAADQDLLPVELRLAAVGAFGIGLLVLGWRLRHKARGYALGLQGGGVAVLYLTTFAALRLWKLLPPEIAFGLLVLIAVFSAILAVRQEAQALAVIGAAGGFMAPILASTGGGSHVMLFSYDLLLNLAVLGIGMFRTWRALNVTAFLLTFAIGLLWGMTSYRRELFATTEPFLVAHFVIFVVVAILFARNQPPRRVGFVDGTLVFGVPLAAFGLQAGMVRHMALVLAFSSLAMAALYLLLAAWLKRTGRESWRLLSQAYAALGVVFVTLAIPLALDARWTSASWALEGAAIVWVGLAQRQRIARLFGLLLQVLAGAAYVDAYRRVPGAIPLVDAPFVGAVLMAFAGFWTHRRLLAHRPELSRLESFLVPVFFIWALLWWLFAGAHEVDGFVPAAMRLHAFMLFVAASFAALGLLAIRWAWEHARVATLFFLPLVGIAVLKEVVDSRHPMGNLGWAAWVAAFAVHFWFLARLHPGRTPGQEGANTGVHPRVLHAGGMVMGAIVLALELHWLGGHDTAHGTAWSGASVGVAFAVVMLAAASRPATRRWPVAGEPGAYLWLGPLVIAVGLVPWSLAINWTHDGANDPLPYMPLLNALDMAHVLAGLALVAVVRAARRMGVAAAAPLSGKAAMAVGGIVAFVWLNGVLLRTIHHWAAIPYDFDAMSRSVLVQASLSVFWSVLALGLMVFATRTARRAIWVTGAVLMGVVVVKLFVFDLANVSGIERIVSFIAVGLLMLVIGYFSPVPPRRPAAPIPPEEEAEVAR